MGIKFSPCQDINAAIIITLLLTYFCFFPSLSRNPHIFICTIVKVLLPFSVSSVNVAYIPQQSMRFVKTETIPESNEVYGSISQVSQVDLSHLTPHCSCHP